MSLAAELNAQHGSSQACAWHRHARVRGATEASDTRGGAFDVRAVTSVITTRLLAKRMSRYRISQCMRHEMRQVPALSTAACYRFDCLC